MYIRLERCMRLCYTLWMARVALLYVHNRFSNMYALKTEIKKKNLHICVLPFRREHMNASHKPRKSHNSFNPSLVYFTKVHGHAMPSPHSKWNSCTHTRHERQLRWFRVKLSAFVSAWQLKFVKNGFGGLHKFIYHTLRVCMLVQYIAYGLTISRVFKTYTSPNTHIHTHTK